MMGRVTLLCSGLLWKLESGLCSTLPGREGRDFQSLKLFHTGQGTPKVMSV